MELLTLVLSIAFLQVWGADNPLHRDQWFRHVVASFAEHKYLVERGGLAALCIGLPVGVFLVFQYFLGRLSPWLMLPVSIFVLLYAFGRGELKEIIREYTKACYIENWELAIERAKSLGVDVEDLEQGDWNTLHRHVLDEAGYRGFERTFAVFFWFFVLGPAGALLYRLLFIYARELQVGDANGRRVLWLLEWPAVRLVGISFAITGNFVGCYSCWQECVFCRTRSTVEVLSPLILGALFVDEKTAQTGAVTRKELVLLHRLYRRTLWFWLAIAALIILVV